jgi:hypothetical protein
MVFCAPELPRFQPAGQQPAFQPVTARILPAPEMKKPGAKPGFQYMDGLVSTGK